MLVNLTRYGRRLQQVSPAARDRRISSLGRTNAGLPRTSQRRGRRHLAIAGLARQIHVYEGEGERVDLVFTTEDGGLVARQHIDRSVPRPKASVSTRQDSAPTSAVALSSLR
jgi:hypothetical protein